jgi:hypothetical protein
MLLEDIYYCNDYVTLTVTLLTRRTVRQNQFSIKHQDTKNDFHYFG